MIFEKYESTGNDFLITTSQEVQAAGIEFVPAEISDLAKDVCDRHFGIGADGLLILGEPGVDISGFGKYKSSPDAQSRMYLINSDGSQAEMSGNGSRCFGVYAASNGLAEDSDSSAMATVETLAGIKTIRVTTEKDRTFGEVNMGRVLYRASDVPVVAENTLDISVELLGKSRRGIAVNSGVPHWVILVDSRDELDSPDLSDQALSARFDKRFPNATNVSVALVESKSLVSARVFERGADETLSCGTGATAIGAAMKELGICNAEIEVSLRGGNLNVRLDSEGNWLLGGPVRKIARCETA